MEYGMGFNGEKGIERTALSRATDEVMERMVQMLWEDMNLEPGGDSRILNPYKGHYSPGILHINERNVLNY